MKNLALGLTIVLFSSLAFAGGGMEGGGGVGVRCGTKLELLDLHEARLSNLKLVEMPEDDEETINLVSKKMASHFQWFTWENPETWWELYQGGLVHPMYIGGEFLYSFTDLITGEERIVMAPVEYVSSLPLSPDIGSYKIQPGCQLEQIAYMTEGNNPKLEIVKSRWLQLDRLSRAALVAHETLYHFDRQSSLRSLLRLPDDRTSEWAREFVGRMFSTQPPPPIMTGVPDDTPLIYCMAEVNEDEPYTTFVVRETTSGFRAVFEELNGADDLYQIFADFSGLSFSKFSELSAEGNLTSTVSLNGNAAPTHLKLELKKEINKEEFELKLFKNIGGKTAQIGNTRNVSCLTAE